MRWRAPEPARRGRACDRARCRRSPACATRACAPRASATAAAPAPTSPAARRSTICCALAPRTGRRRPARRAVDRLQGPAGHRRPAARAAGAGRDRPHGRLRRRTPASTSRAFAPAVAAGERAASGSSCAPIATCWPRRTSSSARPFHEAMLRRQSRAAAVGQRLAAPARDAGARRGATARHVQALDGERALVGADPGDQPDARCTAESETLNAFAARHAQLRSAVQPSMGSVFWNEGRACSSAIPLGEPRRERRASRRHRSGSRGSRARSRRVDVADRERRLGRAPAPRRRAASATPAS